MTNCLVESNHSFDFTDINQNQETNIAFGKEKIIKHITFISHPLHMPLCSKAFFPLFQFVYHFLDFLHMFMSFHIGSDGRENRSSYSIQRCSTFQNMGFSNPSISCPPIHSFIFQFLFSLSLCLLLVESNREFIERSTSPKNTHTS